VLNVPELVSDKPDGLLLGLGLQSEALDRRCHINSVAFRTVAG
jgi:hypothetical protein